MYEASGNIKVIYDTQTFPSGFSKREFVVTTAAAKYPQDLKFELVKDKCGLLDQFSVDDFVQVSFDVRGNEYNGKYYVNLACWKLERASSSGSNLNAVSSVTSNHAEPSMDDLRNEDNFDDDIPF